MLGALYLLIKLNQSSSEHTIYFHLFELLNLFWLYLSASKLYISFRFLNYGQTYENYFKIFDLFVNILIGAHFIVNDWLFSPSFSFPSLISGMIIHGSLHLTSQQTIRLSFMFILFIFVQQRLWQLDMVILLQKILLKWL